MPEKIQRKGSYMKKLTSVSILFLAIGWAAFAAHAATLGCIDVQKVFTAYEKTQKVQEQIQKKEKAMQDDIAQKQKQLEKAKSKGVSEEEINKMIGKFEKELDPQRADIKNTQQKIFEEIQNDIIKATEAVAREKGVDVVLDKQAFVTGGTDLSDRVIEVLNKK